MHMKVVMWVVNLYNKFAWAQNFFYTGGDEKQVISLWWLYYYYDYLFF